MQGKIYWIIMAEIMLSGCSNNRELIEQNIATIASLRNQVVDLRAENAGLKKQLDQAQQSRIPSGVLAVGVKHNVNEGVSVSENQKDSYEYALSLYQAGDIDRAISVFQRYLQTGAQGEQATLAQYWIGDAYYTQQNYMQAIDYFSNFIKNMPQSDKIPLAIKKMVYSLQRIGRNNDAQILQNYGISALQ